MPKHYFWTTHCITRPWRSSSQNFSIPQTLGSPGKQGLLDLPLEFNSAGLRWGPRICNFSKFLCDANTTGPGMKL